MCITLPKTAREILLLSDEPCQKILLIITVLLSSNIKQGCIKEKVITNAIYKLIASSERH